MTLLTRLGRLFRADLNAVLDGLEEPAALLKQAVREMEEILAGEDAEHAQLGAEETRLVQAIADYETRLAQLDDELSLCLGAGKDELARGLVRRKLEVANHGLALAKRQQGLRERQALVASRVLEHRQRLATLRAQAALTGGANVTPGEDSCTAWSAPSAVSEAEIEVALLREKQRRATA
jgi:phage shock protein A